MEINKMRQGAGDNSTNIQVAGSVTIGVSCEEARQIALDIFKANFYEFSEKAAQKALQRAEEITENFIDKFFTKLPHLISKLEEPSVQSSIFNVQKEYAKTGDEVLENRLIELLIERIDSDERSLRQIVLDEAILVLPKLTNEQVSILTLIFSIVNLNNMDVTNIQGLANFLNNRVLKFYPDNINSYSFFTHLQFSGCCIVIPEGAKYIPFEEICRTNLKGLFAKGFTKEEFKNDVDEDIELYNSLIIKCLRNPALLQFNVHNDNILNKKVDAEFPKFALQLKSFWQKNIMTVAEVKQAILEINPKAEKLIKDWQETELKTIKLTSVGVAIAALNYNKQTGQNISLDQLI